MPNTYSIKTQDGTVYSGIPFYIKREPGAIRDYLAQRQAAEAQAAAVPAAIEAPTPEEEPLPSSPKAPEMTAEGAVGSMLRGGGPVTAGAAAGALMGAPTVIGAPIGALVGAGSVLAIDLVKTLVNSALGTNLTSPSDAMNELMTRLGVPDPKSEGEKVLKSVIEGATGALAGAGIGKLVAEGTKVAGVLPEAQPVAQRVAAQMAAQPGAQAIAGGAAGAGSETARALAQEAGLGPKGQALASLVGGLGAGTLAGAASPRAAGATITSAEQSPLRQEQAALIAAGERAGVPVPTSDVFPPQTAFGRTALQLSEAIPVVGTGKMQVAKQAARQSAAKDLLENYGAAGVAEKAGDVLEALSKTRETRVMALKGKKQSVIDSVANTGGAMPTPNTDAAISSQITKLSQLPGDAPKSAIAYLQDLKSKMTGQPIDVIEEQRKALGTTLDDPQKFASIKDAAAQARNEVYAALRSDMTDHIAKTSTPQDLSKWQDANEKLASMAQELQKYSKLTASLNAGEGKIAPILSAIRSSDPSDLKKIAENLTPKGKQNLKALVVSDIAEASGGLESISPEKFLTQVKKKSNQLGIVLSKPEMKELEGLQLVLKRTARGGAEPKTGYAAIPLLSGSAASTIGAFVAGGPGAIAAPFVLGAPLGIAGRIFESKAVRDLLVKMPEVKLGSPQEGDLLRQIYSAINAVVSQQPPAGQQEASAAQ